MNYYKILVGLLLFNYVLMNEVVWASGKGDSATDTLLTQGPSSTSSALRRYFSASQLKDSQIETITGSVVLLLIDAHDAKQPVKDYTVRVSNPVQKRVLAVPVLEFTSMQWYALLPIPYDLKNDTYTVTVMSNQQETLARTSIVVETRSYVTEEVALNENLAQRKSKPASPKVITEANEIWSLTGQVNSEMYDFENFVFPVKSYKYVTGMYSDTRDYVYLDGTHITKGIHGGIDIAAAVGTPVYAAGRGKVVLAKFRVVTGNSIVLEHFPGMFTMYYHLNTIDADVGDIVSPGTQIGTVGSTGFSTGAHLHWETRVNNVRVDPLLLLDIIDKIRTLKI